MTASTSMLILEHESRRLGELWRSQGEEFLEEQAEIILADVTRLRETYLAGLAAAEAPKVTRSAGTTVIDLRDEDVSGMACSREGHSNIAAVTRCVRCRNVYCASDVVAPEALRGKAICTECALAVAGVHHKRPRPLVAPGRPGRPVS